MTHHFTTDPAVYQKIEVNGVEDLGRQMLRSFRGEVRAEDREPERMVIEYWDGKGFDSMTVSVLRSYGWMHYRFRALDDCPQGYRVMETFERLRELAQGNPELMNAVCSVELSLIERGVETKQPGPYCQ